MSLTMHRTFAIALTVAFLAVSLAAVGAPPPAAAHSIYLEETETTAGPTQQDTQRTVTVLNNDNAPSRLLHTVTFTVATKGGTGGQPVQSIDWDATKSSGPIGWLVDVDNSAPRKLTFTAPAGGGFGPTEARPFILGFDVMGNPPNGVTFIVDVKARFSDNQETPAAETYTITIDSSPPAILANGVITVDRNAGAAARGNGRLDHLVIYFDELVDHTTFQVQDFKVTDNQRATPREYDITNAQWLTPVQPGQPIIVGGHTFGTCPSTLNACDGIELTLAEGFEYDTGVKPDLTAANPTLRDIGGNVLRPVKADSVLEIDGAHPVLVSALAKDLDGAAATMEGMAVTFSEPVRGFSGGSGARSLTTLDFEYLEFNCPSCSGGIEGTDNDHAGVSQYWEVVHPPGDAAPEDLHLADIQFNENGNSAPLTAADVRKDNPDRLRCAAGMVRDLSSSDGGQGLLCLHPPTTGETTAIQVPGILQAEINIDQSKIVVDFLVPVSDASGDNVPVRAEAFDIVPTDGGGPQGVIRVEQGQPCTNKVVVHLDKPAKPTDVDNTPSYLRIIEGSIKGCRSGAANPLFVPAGDEPLIDLTPPAVHRAHTVDEDSNGIIDGFFLEFTEPISDRSFCGGLDVCPNYASGGLIQLNDPSGRRNLSVFTDFTFDSDLAVDDRFGVLRWDEKGGPALDTGFVPDLWLKNIAPQKIFADLSMGSQALRSTELDLDARLNELDGAPPVILAAQTVDRETRLTGEPSGQGTQCTIGVERLCEADPDGLIDGYRLIFSEPVKDTTFRTSDWSVDGRRVAVAERGPVTSDPLIKDDLENDERVIIAFCEGHVSLLAEGNTCAYRDLPKNVTVEPDTAEKPQLTYKQPPPVATGTSPGVADMHGNRMLNVDLLKVLEQDGARPVLFRVEGFVNQTQLRLIWSEPVDGGVGEQLIRSDLTYNNGNSVPLGTSAEERVRLDDRASGFDHNIEVNHTPGSSVSTVQLNAPLTAMDVLHDRVAANVNSVRENAIGVVDKKYAMPTFKHINRQVDLTEPGAVAPVIDQVSANSITLRWTAPGDDGIGQGDPVCGYIFKVDTDFFEDFTRSEAIVEAGAPVRNVAPAGWGTRTYSIIYTPGPDPDVPGSALARPGETQRAEIVGLDPETEYNIAVLARDCDLDAGGLPMVSKWTGTVTTAETIDDPTPPTGTLNLRSTTHPPNRPVLVRTANFQWDRLTDPQSTVVYHYVLDDQPDTQVTRQHAVTAGNSVQLDLPSTGTWYFHIRGFSGGGGEPATTMYKIVYGYGPLSLGTILDYNLELHNNTLVTREGDANVITWQLPPVDTIGEIQALRVWRLESGRYALLDTVEGDHARLSGPPNNQYRDESAQAQGDTRYVVDAVFLTDQHGGDPSLATFSPIGADIDDPRASTWVWWALGGAILLIIGGLVAFAIVRARHVPPSSYLDEVGIDEETGLPSHRVTCPTCSHGFSAVGHTPLEITCPECGTTGVLE